MILSARVFSITKSFKRIKYQQEKEEEAKEKEEEKDEEINEISTHFCQWHQAKKKSRIINYSIESDILFRTSTSWQISVSASVCPSISSHVTPDIHSLNLPCLGFIINEEQESMPLVFTLGFSCYKSTRIWKQNTARYFIPLMAIKNNTFALKDHEREQRIPLNKQINW